MIDAPLVQLDRDSINLVGDVLVASASIAYAGPFTPDFRETLVAKWQQCLEDVFVVHTPNCTVRGLLADATTVRAWTLAGLPTDNHSIENAIIMTNSRRWPLLVDPQGQANRFVKSMGRDAAMAPNGIDVVRQTDKKFVQALENGIRLGKWVLVENVSERLDNVLESLLLQQRFKQGGAEMIKVCVCGAARAPPLGRPVHV